MLRSLHIENYVLIDSLDITFPEGLVIITGQTGAGKSIILGALSLLTGVKADPAVISGGASSCVVEGEFDVDIKDSAVRALLDENEIDCEDGALIIRRVVASTGRSRCFVNDCPVVQQVLSDLAGHLVDIHSQNQSLKLSQKSFQMSVLDHFSGSTGLVSDCSASWKKLQSLKSDLASAKQRLERLAEEKDYNQAQFDQLDKAAIAVGELEELEEEQKILANAEEIKENLCRVLSSFESVGDGVSVSSIVKEARKTVQKTANLVPSLSDASERLEALGIELSDILSDLEAASDKVNLSEDRLLQIDNRIALIYSLFTKFGCRTEEELLARKEKFGAILFDSSALEDTIQSLQEQISREQESYEAICRDLTKKRRAAAPKLGAEIQQSIRNLELDRAVFSVSVDDSTAGPDGADDVNFLFSSTGTSVQNVAKCASGGELSRIMLSLKALMARFVGMPTLIFDEIDTGVSGSAADRMGAMICRMGKDMQVFAITHLPQVAAKGDAHFVVSRADSADGRQVSRITEVKGDDRRHEIARLLSGATVTTEALANADVLLKEV